jgi:hypothetical protein
MTNPQTKTCTKCKSEKEVSQFYRHSGGLYGVKSQCKVCVNARNSAYLKNNPDVRAKVSKKQEQREEVKDYRKLYQKTNRGLFRHYNMKRYAKKKSASPPWLTQEHLDKIAGFYYHARDCELVSGQPYHVDHIVPLQGKDVCGLHVPWNLQVLPSDVNQSKSNKHDPEGYS